jgi:hypothetical protein
MRRYFRLRFIAPILAFLGLCLLGHSGVQATPQEKLPTPLHDNSDWWSGLRTVESDDDFKPDAREFPAVTFRVLGIPLGQKQFKKAAAVLGAVEHVERGDAATGREQACYVSSGAGEKIYLIFEQGELEFSFYLFAGGPPWYGSDRCAPSRRVRRAMGTDVGLRLGQTPQQVIAILGKPTKRERNTLIYSFLVEKPLSPRDLAWQYAHSGEPKMSKEQFKKEYGNYDLSEYVEARFAAGKLNYLTVSKAESY